MMGYKPLVATLHRDHGEAEAIVLIDRGVATMVGQEESTYLQSLIVGYMPASSIHVAAEIGLADIIHDGKVTADAISDASGLERNRGFRLLRYLVALGILETDGTRYSLTAVGDLLRSDVPGSMRAAARLHKHLFPAFAGLEGVLRGGGPAYDAHYGRSLFEEMTRNPELAAVYDAAMTRINGEVTAAVVETLDLSEVSTLMDVGGGNGTLITALLERWPDLRGVLFDQPHVIERSTTLIADAGQSGRCATVGGDFFKEVPEGADSILLRNVLHDWPDDQASRILRNCLMALAPGGRIFIVEMLIDDDTKPALAKRMDLSMLTVHGGAERSRSEFEALFSEVGARLEQIISTNSPSAILVLQAGSA